MKSQSIYTIYAVNDVVTSATAPTNPYTGQLWVDTSESPPITKVYDGTAWVEQNGTDTLKESVTTLTTRASSLETNLNGLTSTVSEITQEVNDNTSEIKTLSSSVTTLKQTASSIESRVEDNEDNISSLTQNVSSLTTRVSTAEGNISTITQNVSSITTRVSTAEGNISTINQNVSSVTTRVSNAEDDISSLEQDVSSITTRVSTAEGNISTISQNVSLITTRVTTAEGNISTITQNVSSVTTRVSTAEGNISTLQQTTSSLSATVTNKVDSAYGSSSSTFGWSLTSSGFYVYSGASTVVEITSSGLSVSGEIVATSGSFTNCHILGSIYFGESSSYFLNPNNDNESWYIYLPKFRVDDTSAYFSGTLQSPGGTIGGFTISSSSIYKTKTSYSSTTSGVYIGTDGIGLGAGTFYVTSAGYLYASNAAISGSITASSGTIGGFTIGDTSIYSSKTSYSSSTSGVYIGTDGIGLGAGTFYVTSSGSLYSTSGTIGGFTIGSSSLTNSSGGSYIEITSGNYTTTFSANTVKCFYTTTDGTRGWTCSLSAISITAYTSSTYSGVKMMPTYTKRTSSSVYTSTTVVEGCITSIKLESYNADSSTTTAAGTPFIIGVARGYNKSPYTTTYEWGAYARFYSYNIAELVYDSAYSGIWRLRNVSGSSYDLTTLIPLLNTLYSNNGYSTGSRTFYYVSQAAVPTSSTSWTSMTVYVATIRFGAYYLHCGRINAARSNDAWIYYNDTTAIAAWISPAENSSLSGSPVSVCGAHISSSSAFTPLSSSTYKGRPVWYTDSNTIDAGAFLFWISTTA